MKHDATTKRHLEGRTAASQVLILALVASLVLPLPSLAAPVALATAPLATATTSTVLPNVMFVLDDSGSMNWDFMPDWSQDKYCKDTAGGYTLDCCSSTGSSGSGKGHDADTDACWGGTTNSTAPFTTYRGHPPFLSAGFNGVYYNPAITYKPPVFYNADGTNNTTTYPSIGSPWTSVPNDGYKKQNTNNINLVSGFPDEEWCTDNTFTNCLRNDNYILPGTVGGANYKTFHATVATGSGSVATGSPAAVDATTAARSFGPHYYTIIPGEYCDSPNLKNCQTTATTTFTYAASLRWCDSAALTNCQALNNSTFKFPRYPTTFFTPAVAHQDAVPPVAEVIGVTGVRPTGLITFSSSGTTSSSTSAQINDTLSGSKAVVVGGYSYSNNIAVGKSKTPAQAASAVVTAIGTGGTVKAYIGGNSITPTCAAKTNNVVCLVDNSTYSNGTVVSLGTWTNGNTVTVSTTATAGGVTPVTAVAAIPGIPEVLAQAATYYGSFMRTDIVPGTNSYPYPGTAAKAATRTDCAGTTCTYAEEMTNFANWWAYYHSRMQAMKSSVSRAFKTLDKTYRVGFTTINDTSASNGTSFSNATFLGNDAFELAHKNRWFNKLFGAVPSGGTPLRGALSKAGRYYANKITGQVDPVQYSCQQNFSILSTDGYWNTGSESNDNTYKNTNLSGGLIGNMDASPVLRPMFEGPTASSGSLADIAKYYYDTDLRTTALGNCTGGKSTDFPTGNPDVCTNNVFVGGADNNLKQHMTTFTMGLGAEGTLTYTSDYLTATSGDYFDLANGLNSKNWPDPKVSNTSSQVQERIDDLWHAAVNGQGIYFSARDPDQIITGFNTALSSIKAKLGSAAAAATSTLNPVAGNNFAYVASYTTVRWIGNLEARSINTTTGEVSESAAWCVESVAAPTCASPGTVVTDTSGSSTVHNCVVTGTTAAACADPGVFDSVAATCTTEIANACTGTMAAKVGATTDTRNIWTANGTGTDLIAFDAAYATANPTNFAAAHINGLNQWGTLTATQQTAAAGVNLINFLRGQNGFEDRAANVAANRLYRAREAVLGDALESQPTFLGKPVFNYPYPGYANYKANNASRAANVYMGANDGMMHAFASSDGTERWAFVPSMVIGNMWQLASSSYSTAHANFANGSPITTDVCTANCSDNATAVWKTILVAGLNGGGRGYYALDITDPATPVLLWEFTPTTGIGKVKNDDVGYSFGQPVITTKADGTWVVLVTSGYNNINPGDGKGYLFVLNAATGAIISKITTGVGDTTTPSGLARIAGWNNEPVGNKVGFVYGGDLLGNVWRFDINSATSAAIGTGSVMKFATLFSDTGSVSPQPITTTPVLGLISNKRVVFIGTGKYLEPGDLTTTQKQTQYAIKDDDATATLVNPRITTGANQLQNQTITASSGTATRTSSGNAVDWLTGRGWWVDFPDGGTGGAGAERVNIDSKLVQGTLLVPTIVPSSTVCSPGGFGWLNFFDYETGGAVNTATGLSSVKYDSTIVGINLIYIGGDPKVEVITSTDPTPQLDKNVAFGTNITNFTGKRVIWRELIP